MIYQDEYSPSLYNVELVKVVNNYKQRNRILIYDINNTIF